MNRDSFPVNGAGATAPPGNVTLHRYVPFPGDGDLTEHDLVILWGLLKAENLAEIFFHDGVVTGLPQFLRFARSRSNWFYAAKRGGAFIGIGVVNGFSSSGNTALAHLASFACGRDAADPAASPFAEAGRQWFTLLRDEGGLENLVALVPRCYRGARRWVELFGFTEAAVLPGALRLARQRGERVTDAVLYTLFLGKRAENPASARLPTGV